jgi:hypothetical protein
MKKKRPREKQCELCTAVFFSKRQTARFCKTCRPKYKKIYMEGFRAGMNKGGDF